MQQRPHSCLFAAAVAGVLALLESSGAHAQAAPGYLTSAPGLHIDAWLPPPPPRDSLAQAADVQAYFDTRGLVATPRGQEAHADDVVGPPEAVARRFTYIMGVTLDRHSAPTLMHMMELVRNDEVSLMQPMKKDVADGGRRRPFVDYPDRAMCPLEFARLGETGSYPSGHAGLGWLWGATLSELAPQFADALIARGMAFGNSRLVCGFHYPSDIAAAQLAMGALLQRLHADPRYLKDLAQAKKEVARALAVARPGK